MKTMKISLVLMQRFVRLWQERISSSSISLRTLACLRYGIKMHGRTPSEIRWRLSLISSHSSSSPIPFRSKSSGTHSSAMLGLLSVFQSVMMLAATKMTALSGAGGLSTHLLQPEQRTDSKRKKLFYKRVRHFPRPVGVYVQVLACGRVGKPERQALKDSTHRLMQTELKDTKHPHT